MNKFEWLKRVRNATTIPEVAEVINEINKAHFQDGTLSEEAHDHVWGACYDKMMELK